MGNMTRASVLLLDCNEILYTSATRAENYTIRFAFFFFIEEHNKERAAQFAYCTHKMVQMLDGTVGGTDVNSSKPIDTIALHFD